MFLALGLVLPFFTGQIREIGNKLLPMHIPVLLCGFLCGPQYGLLVGFITPLLRSLLFSMPPLPRAIGMAFELATYGAVTGLLYRKLPKSKARIYIILIYGIEGSAFTWQMFAGGAFLNAIPGIVVQIILIPVLMLALEKARYQES